MSSIDLTALNAALGAYFRKNNEKIMTLLRQPLESEEFMSDVAGVTDEYASAIGSVDEIVQPYQCEWTPKGTVSLTPVINKVRQIKIDHEIDCIDDLARSWAGFLSREGLSREEWPITRFIIEMIMLPKIAEEMENLVVAKGVYAAPTPGTPGAAVDSVDGFLTVIADLITAGDITPIATGAFTPSTIFANVESFVKAIPAKHRRRNNTILMSDSNAYELWQDYRNSHGPDTNFEDNGFQAKIGNTMIQVKGLVSMEGSDRFLYTAKSNFLRLYDTIINPNGFTVEQRLRKIYIYTDFKRGYGFGIAEEVFVNDQP